MRGTGPLRATLIKSTEERANALIRMKQQSLAAAADQGAEFEQFRRPTRRDVFFATMNEVVPSQALCEVIEPHYRTAAHSALFTQPDSGTVSPAVLTSFSKAMGRSRKVAARSDK